MPSNSNRCAIFPISVHRVYIPAYVRIYYDTRRWLCPLPKSGRRFRLAAPMTPPFTDTADTVSPTPAPLTHPILPPPPSLPYHSLSLAQPVGMVRSFILRIPVVRALTSRVAQPLLPLTTRLAPRSTSSLSGSRPFSHFPARLTSSSPSSSQSSPEEPNPGHSLPPNATLTQRLKHLIKSYGWYALGVYIVLSTLDFTVAFAAVNILGAEHVSKVVSQVKEHFAHLIHSTPPEPGRQEMEPAASHGGSGGHEGLVAMLVLAYTIHKTIFLPVRVGLTAAITPKLVHWLRARGWAGRGGARRAAQQMREKIRNRDGD